MSVTRISLFLLLCAGSWACGEDPVASDDGASVATDQGVTDGDRPPAEGDAEGPQADGTPVDQVDQGAPRDAGPLDSDGELPPDGAVIERPLAPSGVLAPVGRVVHMAIPESPDSARRAGCLVHGAGAGTGPYNLNIVAGGDLFNRLRPDRDGLVPLVLLFRALGWEAGLPADALEQVTLQFMGGAHSVTEGFTARAADFVDEDPEGETTIHFEDVRLRGGWFEVGPTAMAIPFTVFDSPIIPLPLKAVNLIGRMGADGPGLRIDHGVLTGYIDLESLIALIIEIRGLCEADETLGACALIGGQLNRPNEELAELVLSILGNFDARLVDGVAYPCDPAEEGACNAVGLCVTYKVQGVSLTGVN